MKHITKNGMIFINGIHSPKKMKRVYIVYGSEDGNLGVYSNFKRAYKSATDYVTNYGEWAIPLNLTYAQAVKNKWIVSIHEKGNAMGNAAQIETFILND